jgi:hypothetical protein
MNGNNEKELAVFRAKIAIDKTQKKTLAFKCGVSRSAFSGYLNGDVPMPEKVRDCLIENLGLEGHMERLIGV